MVAGAASLLLLLPLYLLPLRTAAQQARVPIHAIACDDRGPVVTPARVAWRAGTNGVRWGEWSIAAGDANIPVRVIVAVVDPTRVALSLDLKRDGGRTLPWSIDDAPLDASLALNAGQFTDDGPWGWVLHRGREWQAPGSGALAGALTVDSAGRVHVLDADSVTGARARGSLREAVQSYPTLLDVHGRPPRPLCVDIEGLEHGVAKGIDRGHRDTRLAIGLLADGRVIIAMTRFDGLGSPAALLPIGPTTPEMASVMKALGATSALMLDGGLSAQLMIRDPNAATAPHRWPGLRNVPLALIGVPVR